MSAYSKNFVNLDEINCGKHCNDSKQCTICSLWNVNTIHVDKSLTSLQSNVFFKIARQCWYIKNGQ